MQQLDAAREAAELAKKAEAEAKAGAVQATGDAEADVDGNTAAPARVN